MQMRARHGSVGHPPRAWPRSRRCPQQRRFHHQRPRPRRPARLPSWCGEGGGRPRLHPRPSFPAVHPSPPARVRCALVDRIPRCASPPPPHRRVAATWMAAAHTSLGPPHPPCWRASPPPSRGRGAARGGCRRQRATATGAPGRAARAACSAKAPPCRCRRHRLAPAPHPALAHLQCRPTPPPPTYGALLLTFPPLPPPLRTSPAVPGLPAAAATAAALAPRRPSPPPPSARPTLLERGS